MTNATLPRAAPSPARSAEIDAPPSVRATEPPLEIARFEAREDSARDAFLRTQPGASIFHTAGWRRAVERVFGHAPRDLVAKQGGAIVGVLPLSLCRTPRFGRHLVSTPYGVYGGPVGATRDIERQLVARAVHEARELGVGRLELRCRDDLGLEGLVASDLYAAFVQDVPKDPAEIWSRMPKRARAEVRKTVEKHRLALSEGRFYVDDLTRLFARSKKLLGSPAFPRAWFEALCDELGEGALVHVVRAQGNAQPIAATMSFVFNGKLDFYYIGVTDDANRSFNATNWLVVRLQELCTARGITRFDLGRSRVDSGPYQFKKNQGFEPATLAYRYALVRSKELPSFNPSNPKTEKLRETWTKLPDWTTDLLSPRLMRFLP